MRKFVQNGESEAQDPISGTGGIMNTPTPIQSHSDEGAGFPDALWLLMGDALDSTVLFVRVD